MDASALAPPVDIVVRVWQDRDPEVISPVADWLTCAALNRVLDNYVEMVFSLESDDDAED